mgnify:CR=1 FL=1
MKTKILFTAIAIVVLTVLSCGTAPNPKTERQYKDRIEHLEYQKHVREQEILRLKLKLKKCYK